MGMLIDGKWTDRDAILKDGAFHRAPSDIRAQGTKTAHEIAERPETFWLIGSYSCPWSHRATLLCAIKHMPIRIHHAFGPRVQGYALAGGAPWAVPGLVKPATHLHEIYSYHDPRYTGRATVPLLWDAQRTRIVSNTSADIFAILDAVETSPFTLRPAPLLPRIDAANAEIYEGLNNAVYRAGFATKQAAYDTAVAQVFKTLDALEQRLSQSRYVFGSTLTETDLRLFPTLLRFDTVYAILFKCALRRLTDYPNLWAYARDLFSIRGVQATVDFDQIRRASYIADTRDPHPIIAIAPEVDWHAPQSRADLGPAELALRDGGLQRVDPTGMTDV